MAEEHGFHAPEGGHHRLCVNNCGFFGSPATENMCSKCYRDLALKQSPDSSIYSSTASLTGSPSSSTAAQPSVALVSSPEKAEVCPAVVEAAAAQPPPPQNNRCLMCRKKVGLTGFRCRCGTTFCGAHRYPEKHGCTFDFKAMGREAIAKANPVVKADKLEKI